MFRNVFPENRAVYEVRSKNMVEPERPQTIWRMRVVCWICEATHALACTHTYSEYVTVIAFPQQQWFHERSSLVRFTYVACLVYFHFVFLFIYLASVTATVSNWTSQFT